MEKDGSRWGSFWHQLFMQRSWSHTQNYSKSPPEPYWWVALGDDQYIVLVIEHMQKNLIFNRHRGSRTSIRFGQFIIYSLFIDQVLWMLAYTVRFSLSFFNLLQDKWSRNPNEMECFRDIGLMALDSTLKCAFSYKSNCQTNVWVFYKSTKDLKVTWDVLCSLH